MTQIPQLRVDRFLACKYSIPLTIGNVYSVYKESALSDAPGGLVEVGRLPQGGSVTAWFRSARAIGCFADRLGASVTLSGAVLGRGVISGIKCTVARRGASQIEIQIQSTGKWRIKPPCPRGE